MLESSKSFAKKIMFDVGIPTAGAIWSTSKSEILRLLNFTGVPIVIKYDGLMGGKGVTVCNDIESPKAAIDTIYSKMPNATVLLEDKLEPHPEWKRAEISVIALVDKYGNYSFCDAVQDYKPVYDGDEGPNTGGMGCFTPVPGVTNELMEEIDSTIFRPLIREMKEIGSPFSGVLYAGLMITEHGPQVLNGMCALVILNVRFCWSV